MAMEKAAKSKMKLLKFLPKAASAVTFQNPPFSPSKDKRCADNANKLKTHVGKGFSGPIISIIPAEALRKTKNSSFEAQEPTSPKVSCMGQIKHKHKTKINKKTKQIVSLPKDFKPVVSSPTPSEAKKKPSNIQNIFSSAKAGGRKSDIFSSAKPPLLPDRAPSLSQMKRFASGRDKLTSLDWAAQIAPVDSDHRNYFSDEESEGEEEEVIIPFSAPILVGGSGVVLEPRKEVNLWKRRTTAQPRPLQLNTLVTANS
uniref:Uncharacterized protein n=1 Tax=Davidia involucrata TaxID=16924 RepID=A0A5B6YUU1_DAVIN